MPQSRMTKTFAKYLRMGIIPRTVRSNWKDGDYMYSLYHNEVQYAIDDMGDYEIDIDVSYILECLDNRDLIIKRHHSIVQAVYAEAKSKLGDEVWVRIGTGQQLNCTFGNHAGEFAHLILDYIDPEEFDKEVKRLKTLIATQIGVEPMFEPIENFALMIMGNDNAFIFEDFSHPDIEIVFLDDIDGGHNN
jgi:hypothetical protein